MSYINTARKSRLTINSVDESSRMISWAVNDDSLFKNGIMRTSGVVVLGTTALTQYDYQKEAYKRGQIVKMELWNEADQAWDLHPRGLLYVVSSTFSAETQEASLEIGCKLSIWTLSDNVEEMYEYSVIELTGGQRTVSNISQGLYSSNKLIYQNNAGDIVQRDIFDFSAPVSDPSGVPATWATGSKTEALSAAPLDSDGLPDIVDLEYSFTGSEVFSAEEKISTDTSVYDVNFSAGTWVRNGSGEELNSVTTIDASYSGAPGAAIGSYVEVANVVRASTSRTETTTEYFNGPGGLLTRSVQESYQPGTEVNASYFEDQYSSCRYQEAIDGDADSTACSYLQATSPMLASRVITSLTYDDVGTITSRRVETWKPVLAAAQDFNWKAGDGEYGQVEDFKTVSLTDIYRDTIVITDYSQDEDGNNIETITTYRSGAVEYNAGIYATTGVIGEAEVTVSEPSSYPDVQGTTSLAVPTTTSSGSGSGMTVNVAWASTTGAITELTVTSPLTDCQWGIRPTGFASNQWYPLAANDNASEQLADQNYCGLLYWGALPDTGTRQSGSWSGGSGSGFDGYIPSSSLPSIWSNVFYSNNRTVFGDTWTISVSSTDFAGPSNEVVSITERGSGYRMGDIITWTNNITPALQFGSKFSSLGQALATDYGQSLNSTTITAQVTGVSLIKPSITIADPGSNYSVGDQVRVTAATLTASLGQQVDQDLVFTITSGANGITDLGDGLASISQTDYSSAGNGEATDQYASTSGSVLWDFRYDQTEVYPSTITSTGGSNGSTGRFSSYSPAGEGIVSTPQITPFSVRNEGLLIIDNGYIRSTGISGSLIKTTSTASANPQFCWESWVYVKTMSNKGMALCHWGTGSYPSTAGNWITANQYQNEYGWGAWIRGGNVSIGNIREDAGSFAPGFSLYGNSLQGSYPTGEWFHVAVTGDNIYQSGGVANYGSFNLYINGSKIGSTMRYPAVIPGTVYCYTGAGGFNQSSLVNNSLLDDVVSVQPSSSSDYLNVALSQTRFISGSPVYYGNFSPIDATPSSGGGGTFTPGEYEALEAVAQSGIGKAATVNLEVITGGAGGAGGTGWDPAMVSPALPYIVSIGTVTTSGGSGTGMILELGIGYDGESYSGQSPIVIRTVLDGGNGYVNGDVLSVSVNDMEALLASYGGGSVDNNLTFPVTPSTGGPAASAWLFPEVVGTQFAVGDTILVTRTEMQAAGAGDPGQDVTATVTAVTPAKPLQNLTLDAIDGGKRVVVNTSKTDSTLADTPDTNATPALPTLESRLPITIRTDGYESAFGGIPDSAKESLQVPLEYSSHSDVYKFTENYSTYLKSFLTGEGYGLRIGESMRTEIVDNWVPMAGLRYTDERIDETFAMQADAASWGVSKDEAAVVYNGVWRGTVSYSSPGVEDFLDVGKMLSIRLALSFDAAETFTLSMGSTDYPVSVDWEGSALTDQVTTDLTTHAYEEGNYTLNVYHDAGDASKTSALSYSSYSTSAAKIKGAYCASGSIMDSDLSGFLRGATILEAFVASSNADFSAVTNLSTSFQDCASLAIFPSFTTSSSLSVQSAWYNCASLQSFPANFFDHVVTASSPAPFDLAWSGCALSAESVENILTSLDTMSLLPTDSPVSDTDIHINGGTNAGYSTWSTAAQGALTSLQSKGWNVLYNS